MIARIYKTPIQKKPNEYGRYFLAWEAPGDEIPPVEDPNMAPPVEAPADQPPMDMGMEQPPVEEAPPMPKRNMKVIEIKPRNYDRFQVPEEEEFIDGGMDNLGMDAPLPVDDLGMGADIPPMDTGMDIQPPIEDPNMAPPVEAPVDQPPMDMEIEQPPVPDMVQPEVPPMDNTAAPVGAEVPPPVDTGMPMDATQPAAPAPALMDVAPPPMDMNTPAPAPVPAPDMGATPPADPNMTPPPAPMDVTTPPPADGAPVDGPDIDSTPANFDAGMDDGTGTDQPPVDNTNGANGPGLEYDSTRKYILFKNFMSLSNAIENYISKLEAKMGTNDQETIIYKNATDKLREIGDLCYDYLTMKFEISTYIQSLLFFQNLIVMVQSVFDLIEKSMKKVKNRTSGK